MPDHSSLWLQKHATLLQGMRRGIEKESLRVDAQGQLAQTPHPLSLGSALTHPHLTTDYSEALLELITPATLCIAETLDFLADLHRFTVAHLPDEMLWVHSMPCFLGEDQSVPLAQYGTSATGQMKTVYRHGLGMRYTRRMQTIAGIHYNLSFPEVFWQAWREQQHSALSLRSFIDTAYFGLLRNFQRSSWLLIYLLGASPAVCASFMRHRPHHLQPLSAHTLFLPWATSLRMSDIGYQNTLQADLHISYNQLNDYLHGLEQAIHTPFPAFTALGVRNPQGQWLQLNDHLLQIENEYYGLIRPKRSPRPDERPGRALQQRGVEYIEMRCVDLNPFCPLGIDVDDAHFLEIFALYCVLQPSPFFDQTELDCLTENQKRMTQQGRQESLSLCFYQDQTAVERPFQMQALILLEEMQTIAAALDQAHATSQYTRALASAKDRVRHPDTCYSARILERMHQTSSSFFDLASEQSRQHDLHWRQQPLAPARQQHFEVLGQHSLLAQQQIEKEQQGISLETYLQQYFHDGISG